MEHLPIPTAHRARIPQIPYYGLAPKYDRLGFSGFLERHGTTVDAMLESLENCTTLGEEVTQQPSAAILHANSLLQEWCWFGLLHEFEQSCGLEMDFSQATKPGEEGRLVLSTEFLPHYIRTVILSKLAEQCVPLDLHVGDRVYLKLDHVSAESLGVTAAEYERAAATLMKVLECIDGSSYRVEELESGVEHSFTLFQLKFSSKLARQDCTGQAADNDSNYGSGFTIKELAKLLGHHFYAPTSEQESQSRTSTSGLSSSTHTVCRVLSRLQSRKCLVLPEVRSSIRLLCASMEVLGGEVLGMYFNLPARWSDPGFSDSWCPSRTSRINTLVDEHAIAVAVTLPSYDDRSHARCSEAICIHAPLQSADMRPRHAAGCSENLCDWCHVPESAIVDVLSSGGNPCFILSENDHDLLIRDTRTHQYIAISHVWSQGHGNPSANALPWCQVRKLFEYIQDCGPVALWIDTLSVPRERKFKKRAISQMHKVYKDAEAVLVLDQCLQQVGPDQLERQLQILGSEWMTRLWTLQEGKLPKKVLFRFSNGNASLDQVLEPEHGRDDRNFFIGSSVMAVSLRPLFSNKIEPSQQLAYLTRNLAFRRTTVSTDEPICLATLLGLELESFDSKPTMAEIYQRLPHQLPQDLIFIPGPRLSTPGMRWAPSTLLHSSPMAITADEKGKLSEDGFTICKDCILLEPDFELSDEQLKPTVYHVTDSSTASTFVFVPTTPSSCEPTKTTRAAVVLQSTGDAFHQSTRGVLVDITLHNGAAYLCHTIGQVFVVRGEDTEELFRGIWRAKENRFLDGQFSAQQCFCID